MPKITVTISPARRLGCKASVDKEKVKVSQGKGDYVEWKCAGKKNFVVAFTKETPFKEWYFYPGKNRSGPPTVDPDSQKQYKYTVLADGTVLDPIVIIIA